MTKGVQNAGYTKLYNRRLILKLLRQKPQSRADLARATGLTRAAITQIVDEMMSDGKLRELKKCQSVGRGRTPILLEACAESFYAAGVHLHRLSRMEDGALRLDRLSCTVGVTDFNDTLLCQQSLEFADNAAAEDCLSQVARVLRQQLGKLKIPAGRMLGIGVSAPGPVDAERGVLRNPPELALWHGCAVASLLSEKTGLPVCLEKDCDAEALYNHHMEKEANRENFLLLSVGSGVGSGVISDGGLLRSPGGFTPEVGHMSINFHGPTCSCGGRGCLEVYASTLNVLQKYSAYSTWQQLVDSPDGDAALEEMAEYLAAGVLNLSNLVRVEAVLLSSHVLYGFDRLKEKLERNLCGRSLSMGQTKLEVCPALPVDENFVRAAANIVFVRYLDGWEGNSETAK